MTEVLDDSGPLLVLEDIFSDSSDGLDVSFDNLSIHDDPPRTSTPSTDRLLKSNLDDSLIGGKHHLTPSSKQAGLPKPKRFNVGHNTVKMLKRLMTNVDIFGTTRKSFQSRDAFNVHPTTKHHEQDPFPDQVKATHFILRNRFLKPDATRKTVQKFRDPKNASVSSSSIDAYEAGKKKVLENFSRKLFALYGTIGTVNEEKECEDEGSDSN